MAYRPFACQERFSFSVFWGVLALCVSLTACAQTDSNQSKIITPNKAESLKERSSIYSSDSLARDLIDRGDFLGLFKNAEKIGYYKGNAETNFIISDHAFKYLQVHTENRNDIINLLERNGFKIYSGGKYDPKKPDADKPYDERIVARKNLDFNPLYPVHKAYRIFIFMTDGNVDQVIAHAFMDGL